MTPKSEALRALAQLATMLGQDLEPMQRIMAAALVEYVIAQVEQIQQWSRSSSGADPASAAVRRAKTDTPAGDIPTP